MRTALLVVPVLMLVGCDSSRVAYLESVNKAQAGEIAELHAQLKKNRLAIDGDALGKWLIADLAATQDKPEGDVQLYSIGSSVVAISGPADDVRFVNVTSILTNDGTSGTLEGVVLGEIAGKIIPKWAAAERQQWCGRALVRATEDMALTTTVDDVRVTLMSRAMADGKTMNTLSFESAKR